MSSSSWRRGGLIAIASIALGLSLPVGKAHAYGFDRFEHGGYGVPFRHAEFGGPRFYGPRFYGPRFYGPRFYGPRLFVGLTPPLIAPPPVVFVPPPPPEPVIIERPIVVAPRVVHRPVRVVHTVPAAPNCICSCNCTTN